MTTDNDIDIYRIGGPTLWPKPPSAFSFSSLSSIERCPRQWQLAHARYGSRDGFPSRPVPAAVEGQIVHEALERLFRACGFAGMPTVGSKPFVEVITDLGLGKIIQQRMREREQAIAVHPRGAGFRYRHSASQLANEVIRLFRQQYRPRDAVRLIEPSHDRRSPPQAPLQALHALKAIPELRLKHPSLPFVGVIDLVRQTGAGVTIVDFKTGHPSPAHEQQVLAYAVLWWRVTGEAPAAIEVVYPSATVTKPLLIPQLEETEEALKTRVNELSVLLASQPATAKTGEHCANCDVRQFCSDYWRVPLGTADWVDFEATVTGQKGVAAATVSLPSGENADVVFQPGTPSARQLTTGSRVAILCALRKPAGVYELVRSSEVFVRDCS